MVAAKRATYGYRHTTQLIDRTGRVDPGTMETFTEADFAVGREVQINGAQFLIYGCDEFTRDYYTKVYGVTFEDIPVQFDENVERPQVVIPPHVAPGSEEDSLGSFLYLIPKVPKKNFRRMMENDRKLLRYMARLDTTAPEDRDRIFVIKYYLADDTVGVFEPPRKNSGIIGGKFLERTRIKKPQSHEYYSQSDFYTGATIEVRCSASSSTRPTSTRCRTWSRTPSRTRCPTWGTSPRSSAPRSPRRRRRSPPSLQSTTAPARAR